MKYQHHLKITYPEQTDAHMVSPKNLDAEIIEESFPFYDKSVRARFLRGVYNFVLYAFMVPATKFRYGLKVKGKKNLRKNRKLLKNGAITVSNHVFDWDYFCVRAATFPHIEFVTIWKHNMFRSLGVSMHRTGGIPVPDTYGGLKAFDRALMDLMKDKRWLHFYPEGSMWLYEETLRPFKKGTFSFALRGNKPVIPLAISYRPPRGLYRWFKKGYPLITISIAKPILPDFTLPTIDAIEKMRHEAETAVASQIEKDTPDVP
jgi:1-acyl-sn-glycerol-3-phosphate acyltransferase